MRKSSSISRIAIFFAVMITVHFVTSFILQFVPSGIQPTLVHIPVVIASIIYGPRTGAILGLLMGLFSVTMNTLVLTGFLSILAISAKIEAVPDSTDTVSFAKSLRAALGETSTSKPP